MVSQRSLLALVGACASSVLAWKHVEEKALREALSINDHSMVAFVKPGTEFTDALEPEWTQLEEQHANFKSVDCVAHGDLCDSFGISTYPAIRFIRQNNALTKIYRGPRKADQISAYLRRATRDLVAGVDTDNTVSFMTIDDVVFILHMTGEDAGKGLYQRYHQLAEHYGDRYSFAVAKIETGGESVLHCYNNLEDRSDSFADFFERIHDMEHFMKRCAEPLVTELTRVNNAEVVDGPFGPSQRLYFFEHNADHRKTLTTSLRDVAKKYDMVRFVVVAPGDHVDTLKKMHMDWAQTPGLVLHQRETGQFYHLPNVWDVNPDQVKDFLRDVFAGKREAWRRPDEGLKIVQEAETTTAAADQAAETPVVIEEQPVVEEKVQAPVGAPPVGTEEAEGDREPRVQYFEGEFEVIPPGEDEAQAHDEL